jgi:HlyD family secretion protein
MTNNRQSQVDFLESLSRQVHPGLNIFLRYKIIIFFVVIGLASIFVWLNNYHSTAPIEYKVKDVIEGDLVMSVTATGATRPTNEVNIGVEISGTISDVFVDFNDSVKKGQLLARIDTSILSAQIDQAKASLQMANAARLEAEVTLNLREKELNRVLELKSSSSGALPSAQELDDKLAARDFAIASLKSAMAQEAQSQAQLSLKREEFKRTQIVAPIDGFVLSRLIEPGQTVTASLQTPELFVIAENLNDMELKIDVDEADISKIQYGQDASFTVDAYPDKTFKANIRQIRSSPNLRDSVVSYEVVLSVDNSELWLRPGMTATAFIYTNYIADALLVPNEALRFDPGDSREFEYNKNKSLASSLVPQIPTQQIAKQEKSDSNKRTIWSLDSGNIPYPIEIIIGASDGTLTEVISGEIKKDMPVVVEAITQ